MSTWTLRDTLDDGDAAYGTDIAIDGDYVLVGDYNNNTAYLYKWNGSSYDLKETITCPEAGGWAFGWAVGLHGQNLVIGAPYYHNGVTADTGAAFRYTLIADTLAYIGRIDHDPVTANMFYGGGIDISDNYCVISASGAFDPTVQGVVDIFSTSTWTLAQGITGLAVGTNSKENPVAIDKKNEDWLAVGLPGYDTPSGNFGAVNMYQLVGATWTLKQTLQETSYTGTSSYGYKVGLDGTTLAVHHATNTAGHGFIYKLVSGTWTLVSTVAFGNGQGAGTNGGVAVDETYNLVAFTATVTGVTYGRAWIIDSTTGGDYSVVKTFDGTGGGVGQYTVSDDCAISGAVVGFAGNAAPIWLGANFTGLPLTTLVRRTNPTWRLRLKIEGVSKTFYQFDGTGTRSVSGGYYNLLPPQEFATEFNLAEMKPSLSAMTFDLIETDDLYLRKQLGPTAWAQFDHWLVKPGSTISQQIAANATTIPCKDVTTVVPAAGEYSLGQETFSCTGTSGNDITGVQKGLYPPFYGSTYWGRTHERPQEGDAGLLPVVAQRPYSWHGKMVCLFIDVWDPALNCYNAEADGLLMWAGRISDAINFDPARNVWQLSCEAITADLEKELFDDPPTAELADVANLKGALGRTFWYYSDCRLEDGTRFPYALEYEFTVPAGAWQTSSASVATWGSNGDNLIGYINNLITSKFPVGSYPPRITYIDGKCGIAFHGPYAGSPASTYYHALYPCDRNGVPCHALMALGFDCSKAYTYTCNGGDGVGWDYRDIQEAENPPFASYQPLYPDYNGGYMYCKSPIALLQPSGSVTAHTAVIRDVHWGGDLKRKTGYVFRYTAHGMTQITLQNDNVLPMSTFDLKRSFVGAPAGEPPVKIEQIWMAETGVTQAPEFGESKMKGPFEMLLYPLLSTGTQAYNHATYDILPTNFGAGIPAPLVDIQSFLDADSAIFGRPLATRSYYPIDKPISWMELYQREAKLFGYGLTWNRGKLRLANIRSPENSTVTTWLDEATRYNSRERPKMTMSTSTVVNQWECKIYYDAVTGKYDAPIIITNANSVTGLCVTKKVVLEHPGILGDNRDATIVDLLKEEIVPAAGWLGYPLPIIEISLQPRFIYTVWVGEATSVTDSHVPDPDGSGGTVKAMTAIPLKVSWNYREKRGAVTLMITPFVSKLTPMSPSVTIISYDDAVALTTASYTHEYFASDTTSITH